MDIKNGWKKSVLEQHRRVSYQFANGGMGERRKYKEIWEGKLAPAMHEAAQ